VVAVVPAHDEEAMVARTVKALRAIDSVPDVVVVANGCADRTAQEALAAGARVLVSPRRIGKGGAMERGVVTTDADVYLFVDADVGDTASEVARLLDPILEGAADLAIARFPKLGGGGFGMVKRMSRGLILAACGFDTSEPMSGQRAITTAALDGCRPLAPGFGAEVAMTVDAVRLGLRIVEVPVRMTHRPTGRTPAGFAHRGRQAVDVVRASLPRLLRIR
jgi:glycosyltransferase involved in cell wall biosynthesis